ncbi:hypothetical protein ACEPAF_8799 [Sanghuangporus sanghuang]
MFIPGEKNTNEGNPPSPETGPWPSDVPPPYNPAPSSSSLDNSESDTRSRSSSGRERPINVMSMNFTKIKRENSSIKGTFVIDAGLTIPDELLSTLQASASTSDSSDEVTQGPIQTEAKKNLYLESINSGITADVWLVDDETEASHRDLMERAELELRSRNGSINLKLDSTTSRPFSLVVKSKNATAAVALPSDFVGPITLYTVNGSVSLSSVMESRLVIFSEDNGTRKCFVGDYRRTGYTGGQRWVGSVAEVGSVNGRVKLSFVDEVDPSASSSVNGGGSFFHRLFAGF